MTSIILYSLAIISLIISFIKDKSKTKKSIVLGLKSFENVLPQFLCIIITVGILLSFFTTDTISKILGTTRVTVNKKIKELRQKRVLLQKERNMRIANKAIEEFKNFL